MGSLFPTKASKQIYLDQQEFAHLKQKLCLQDQNILDLYEYFRKFDRFDRAYVDFDDFIAHFRSKLTNFVELPYAERLFKCIPKSQQTKLFFEQFVQGISAFCLLNHESLLHFIFDFIDIDGDERITKKDIMRLIRYTDPLNGKQTFFTNFSVELDQIYLKQNQNKIDFAFFRQNLDKLMFLIWPAFSLQQYLRQNILGSNFWLSLYSKVQKKQIQIKNNEKKQQRMRQKMQIMNKIKIKRVDELLFKNKVNNRKPGEVADDSKLLRRAQRPARRSMLYIKDQIQTTNIEIQNMQK